MEYLNTEPNIHIRPRKFNASVPNNKKYWLEKNMYTKSYSIFFSVQGNLQKSHDFTNKIIYFFYNRQTFPVRLKHFYNLFF